MKPKNRQTPIDAPVPPYPSRSDHPDPASFYQAVCARIEAVKAWEAETGKRVISLHGEEIVCSPAEATALIRAQEGN